MDNYEKTNWINGSAPALSAENLNKIENGIDAVTNSVNELETIVENNKSETDVELAKKADKSDTYTKSEIDAELAKKINEEAVYTAEEADEHFQRILTAGDNIKIDDNKQGKITISADLSKKYDAANVESGSGDLSLYDSSYPITSARFVYQRVGLFVTVNLSIMFSSFTMPASKAFILLGLPSVQAPDSTVYQPIITSKKHRLTVAVSKNTSNLTILTQGEDVSLETGELLEITITYKMK